MPPGEVIALLCGLVGLAMISAFQDCICSSIREAQEARATAGRRHTAPAPPTSGAGLRVPPTTAARGNRAVPPRQQPPPAPAAVEMVRRIEPVVSIYRKADGWPEATCAVCLAELIDGVNVRVLPLCMHYFHASCVGEWLLAHHTCPVCRAPVDPAAAAA